MKYMHFNFSCSFAGLANMLYEQGIDTEDYQIAAGMKTAYLMDLKEDSFLTGPMLQTKEWQAIYLTPLGFEMEEEFLEKNQLLEFLKSHVTCMLGVRTYPNAPSRHAIIFTGYEDGKLRFINNKREDSKEPEEFLWTEEEFLNTIDRDLTMVGWLRKCEPRKIDLLNQFERTLEVFAELETKVFSVCRKTYLKVDLRELQDKMFRAVFLDNISALKLVQSPPEQNLAEQFEVLQKQFLSALKLEQDEICLANYMDLERLKAAFSDWKKIIEQEEEKYEITGD